MKRDSLGKRYDAFCEEARDLLNRSGLTLENQTPVITGKAFYEACGALATIHFPEDKEVNGIGPRGLLWGMYAAVTPSHVGGRDPDPISGARSIALVLERIIKNRPPLDIKRPTDSDEASSLAVDQKRAKPAKVGKGMPSTLSIFLSHSSADVILAASLVRLLQRALRLPAEKIRCSSVDGYRLSGGDLTETTLRQEIFDADALVGLVTPASLRSQYVLFELGARWGSGRLLMPVLAGGIESGGLRPPIANLNCLDACKPAHMLQVITELAKLLAVDCDPPHALLHDLEIVADLARAKRPDSSVIRQSCLQWASDDTGPEECGDLHLFPVFLNSADEVLAFVDGTKDCCAVAGVAITASGIAWRNRPDEPVSRLTWTELAATRIAARNDDVVFGNSLRIDLSNATYEAGAVADLLCELVRKLRH